MGQFDYVLVVIQVAGSSELLSLGTFNKAEAFLFKLGFKQRSRVKMGVQML